MRYRLLAGSSAILAASIFTSGHFAAYKANALPSYARQTGADCAACHVGGFGPQLTAYGRQFKLGGYSDGETKIPLSGMVVANYTHTKSDRAEPVSGHDGTNDNVALQEASVFVAGRLATGLGTFIQTTYSEIDRHTSLDHFEVRYAHPLELLGDESIVGLSINNNPTLQDPFNSVGAWSFPYTSSDLGFESIQAPLLQGGIEHQALGATAYASLGSGLYIEAGGYKSLKPGFLNDLGIDSEAGRIKGVAPYWRAVFSNNWGKLNLNFGLIGITAKLNPDRDGNGKWDKYSDFGIDGNLQYPVNRKNLLTANFSFINEKQTLDHQVSVGITPLAKHTLKSLSGDVSWYYDRHYGLTLGGFHTSGTHDPLLNPPGEEEGSRTGYPDTDGYVVQADWSPFGGEGQSTFANLRLGLQYKGYTKFNGAKTDYDGSGRNASDNNTLTAFVWTAF